MTRPPVHYRQPRAQPRAPQAVRVRTSMYGELFAVCMMFLIGCLFALSVLVLVLLAVLWAASSQMGLTAAFAVALFVAALVGATLIGLWAVSR